MNYSNEKSFVSEYIHDFLCVAAHSQKFVFQETEEVLLRSASNKKDFSGYKAATGFNAIQLYAGNLLSQPWRKEYRQIKVGYTNHYLDEVQKIFSFRHIVDSINIKLRRI